jgi:hypothetical protein
MVSRSNRALIALALSCLALPALAVFGRISVYFLATFDLPSAPGEPPPLAADSGLITVTGPGFSVVPGVGGGGVLKAEGLGLPTASKLHGTFTKGFKGSEIVIDWTITAGQSDSEFSLYCLEENDGEIIDVEFGGDGFVDVDDTPVGGYDEGEARTCSLTLRDNSMGADTWIFTMTGDSGVPVTSSGVLTLTKPLNVLAIDLVLPAGSTGTFLVDDLQATSASFTSK